MQYKTRLNRNGRVYLNKEIGRWKVADALQHPTGLLLILSPLPTTPLWTGGCASTGRWAVDSVFGPYPKMFSMQVTFHRIDHRLATVIRPLDAEWAAKNCEKPDWGTVDWGFSNRELAVGLGVSSTTVHRMRQLWAPEDYRNTRKTSAWREADWSLSNKELARLHGATPREIATARHRYGVPYVKQDLPPPMPAETSAPPVQGAINWSFSNQQIADVLGVSPRTVQRARLLQAPETSQRPRKMSVWRDADWSLSNEELAKLYDATLRAVSKARHRYGRAG